MTGSVLTFGETMGLVRATGIGGWDVARQAEVGIGGADSNVAIGLVRLGVPTTWIGRVGADSLGRLVRRELLAEGVRALVTEDPDHPTGVMLKEKRTSGSTQVLFHRRGSAGSRLGPEDVPAEEVRRSALVHVTGITPALSSSARAATEAVLTVAREAGIPIAFDVNHRSALWIDGDAGELYRSIAARADLVFAGEDEARLMVDGRAPEALAREIAALGPREVIIKLGARGSLVLADGVVREQPAHVISVVDSVGAGDAFVAGYLAALLRGGSVADRLASGTAAGAFACMAPGDWEGAPRTHELRLLTEVEPVAR